jgi:hypothetical protein
MLYLIQYLFCMLVLGRKPHQHAYGPWFVEYDGVTGYRDASENWKHYSRLLVMRVCPCGSCEEKKYLSSDHSYESVARKAGDHLREQIMQSLNAPTK